MRAVEVKCSILLEDDTASWVESLLRSNTLPPELAYYFEQRFSGGYVVTQDEIDTIVSNIITAMEEESEDAETVSQLSVSDIEVSMRKVLGEMLSSINIPLTAVETKSNTDTKDVVEKKDDYDSSNIVSFSDVVGKDESVGDMTDDEFDDLADMFGI